MENWTLVIIIVLVIAFIVVVTFIFIYQRNNNLKNQKNILYPFSASIQPGDTTVVLQNASGGSQIDCSKVGGTINIVGAWSEIIDPMSTCANNSIAALNLTCGLPTSTKVGCKQDADCGPGMTCAGGLCKSASCKLDSTGTGTFDSSKCSCGGNYCPIQPGSICTSGSKNVCNDPTGLLMTCVTPSSNSTTGVCTVNSGQSCMAPDQYQGQFCAVYPLCSNVIKTVNGTLPTSVVNTVCDPNNTITTSICRPRDASAYLAAKCDGKKTCVVQYDPENVQSGFGTRPCSSNVKMGSSLYNKLPNTPAGSGNYTQGYYVHGIYTCILPE